MNASKILVGLSILASLSALGIFLYTEIFYKRPLIDEKKEYDDFMKSTKEHSYPQTYKLDPMIINLKSSTARLRFLDVQIYIIPFSKNGSKLIEDYLPQIYDTINQTAGDMNWQELNSIHGKIILENRLKDQINKITRQKVISEIQFSKFMVR